MFEVLGATLSKTSKNDGIWGDLKVPILINRNLREIDDQTSELGYVYVQTHPYFEPMLLGYLDLYRCPKIDPPSVWDRSTTNSGASVQLGSAGSFPSPGGLSSRNLTNGNGKSPK